MKKLTAGVSALLSLLCMGSLTPANAGPMYLTCALDQTRMLKYGEPKIVGGKVVSVPIEGAAWGAWGPLKNGASRILKFTLNESDQTGSLLDEATSKSYKLPMVTFQPESILVKKSGIALSFATGSDTYTISRVDGSAIWESVIIPGQLKVQYSGQCAKSQPKKTLF